MHDDNDDDSDNIDEFTPPKYMPEIPENAPISSPIISGSNQKVFNIQNSSFFLIFSLIRVRNQHIPMKDQHQILNVNQLYSLIAVGLIKHLAIKIYLLFTMVDMVLLLVYLLINIKWKVNYPIMIMLKATHEYISFHFFFYFLFLFFSFRKIKAIAQYHN